MTKKNQKLYLQKFKSGERKFFNGSALIFIAQHGNELRVHRICGAGLDTFFLGTIELNKSEVKK